MLLEQTLSFINTILVVGFLIIILVYIGIIAKQKGWGAALKAAFKPVMLIPLIFVAIFSYIRLGINFLEPSEVGVVVSVLSPGGYNNQVYRSGLHWTFPFLERMDRYSYAWQIYEMTANPYETSTGNSNNNRSNSKTSNTVHVTDSPVKARTADGQEVSVDCSIIYQVEADQIIRIYVEWQSRYVQDFLRPIARGLIRTQVSQYTAAEVNSSKSLALERDINQQLRIALGDKGFGLERFILRSITFTPEYATSIEQKQIALETGNEDVEVKLVNSALVSIHIDGYKVSNPIGFQGKDVAVQIYTAFAPMVHIGALERVADELALELVAVAAEPFAVSRSVLGTDANSNFTAILADVGGGTTDIAVVNDGGVEGTKMFGIGGRSFTNTIANEMGIGYEDAEKLKVNIDDEKVKESVKKDVTRAVDKTLEVWLAGVELALSEFDSVDHLPPRILLCGGGASLRQLVEALASQEWYKGLPFTKRPSVQHIKPSDVIGITDPGGKAEGHTFITAMGLLRVGYDTMISIDGTDTIKEKLNRMLRI